jgi:cellulose biosynthesis protein BcsQ
MKVIASFNNKGGVGKTSLVYHLGYMIGELGHRVLLADLDPQANLSTLCHTEDRLGAIWGASPGRRPTVLLSDSSEASAISNDSNQRALVRGSIS